MKYTIAEIEDALLSVGVHQVFRVGVAICFLACSLLALAVFG